MAEKPEEELQPPAGDGPTPEVAARDTGDQRSHTIVKDPDPIPEAGVIGGTRHDEKGSFLL